ncbi:DUF2345 domain-containing protein [Proteus vulgaris]|nr:DUF2345 domain-containing protein [Proteus vulgaris]MCT6518983.1 DUF2345 domain-containing protein [Proteus vulgaris]
MDVFIPSQNRYHLTIQGCKALLDVEYFTGREAISDSYYYQITLAAGKAISLFAQSSGIKAFAAKGKVELQAQSDEMHLTSLKDLTVTSTGGKPW